MANWTKIGQILDKNWKFVYIGYKSWLIGQNLDIDKGGTRIGHELTLDKYWPLFKNRWKICLWTKVGQTFDIHLSKLCPLFKSLDKPSKVMDKSSTSF